MGNCGSKSGKYRVNEGKKKKKKERNGECEQASVYPTAFVEGPASPMIGKNQFQQKLLDAQNLYRHKHGSPRLILNALLSEEAQRWANYLSSCQLLKSTSEKCVGENLAQRGVNKSPQFIADLWYNEIQDYDYSRPGFTTATKNFTQLVWKDSTQFGVGVAYDDVGSMYVVGRYSPPGNISKPGYYETNVKQPSTRDDHIEREVEDVPKNDVRVPANFPVDPIVQKDDPITKHNIVKNNEHRVGKKSHRDRLRDSLYDNDDDDDKDCVDFKFDTDDDAVAKRKIPISKCDDNNRTSCADDKCSGGGDCDVVAKNDDRIEKKEEPPSVKPDAPVSSSYNARLVVSSSGGGYSNDDGGCCSGGGDDYGGGCDSD